MGVESKNLSHKSLAQECLDLDLTRFCKDSYDVINFNHDYVDYDTFEV
jgi:hypothetical protein